MQVQDKKARIIAASIQAFGQYGYRKTSMQDIADEAGMSRPALYQYYKNKEAVFMGLLTQVLTCAQEAAEARFKEGGDSFTQLSEGILAFERVALAPTLTTAKGHELLPLADVLAPDEMELNRQWLLVQITLILERAQQQGEVDLVSYQSEVSEIALLILSGLKGVKHSVTSMEELEQQTRLYFQILWSGLGR